MLVVFLGLKNDPRKSLSVPTFGEPRLKATFACGKWEKKLENANSSLKIPLICPNHSELTEAEENHYHWRENDSALMIYTSGKHFKKFKYITILKISFYSGWKIYRSNF